MRSVGGRALQASIEPAHENTLCCIHSLIDKKTEPDKDLAIEVQRNWAEIASGRLQFARLQREAAALLEIEREDLLDFWKRIYSGNGRRVLITEMIPRQGVASGAAPPLSAGYGEKGFPTENYVLGIDDIEEFRRVREKLVYATSQTAESGQLLTATTVHIEE